MITILCSGTRGDVQPYVALAQALGKRGAPVRIASNRDFAPFVEAHGVDFHPVAVDAESLGVDPEMVRQAQAADNLLKMAASFRKMREYGVRMASHFLDACAGSSALVFHPGLALGHFAARRLGIPSILASPFPLHRTGERPSVVLYGKVPSFPPLNRASYGILQAMLWMTGKDALAGLLRSGGGLPADFGPPYERQDRAERPSIISCSEHVFPRPRDWSPHVHQHGYWFVEEGDYRAPEELAAFLAAGEAPVYLGFGSMMDRRDGAATARLALEALARAGKRGIICGMGKPEGLPSAVLAIDSATHAWLFPRMAAIVHHGGAGTSAAAFRSGVPSLIAPFALDQHAWAARSFELGVGARPIPFKRLSAASLARGILEATRPETAARAAELGRAVSAEDGAGKCAEVILGAMEAGRR